MTELLGPAEVRALLADPEAPERHSPLAGEPLLAIDLRGRAAAANVDTAPLLSTLPCVSVGLLSAGARQPASALVDTLDVLVHSEAELSAIAARIRENPLASVALVQLLRLGVHLPVEHALVAESLVYSTLQSGPEFQSWLASRPRPKPRPPACGPAVRIERSGPRLDLILDRPGKRNAYSAEMRDGCCEGLRLVLADPAIEEVVLCGEGRDFCSGGDLDEFGTLPDPATAHAIRTTRSAGSLLVACAPRARAELQGACVGAGIELPAFCGRISARADASFRLPELSMGLVPGAGGTASLPRRIGRQRTASFALAGSEIDVRTALDWGLVDEIRT